MGASVRSLSRPDPSRMPTLNASPATIMQTATAMSAQVHAIAFALRDIRACS